MQHVIYFIIAVVCAYIGGFVETDSLTRTISLVTSAIAVVASIITPTNSKKQ